MLLQAGGLLFVFNAGQGYVQYKMQRRLRSENTVFEKLTLTSAEFQKCRVNSSEVLFHDDMYDFKSVNFNGDKVELLVIHDREEGVILEMMENLVNNTSPLSKDAPNPLQKLISLVYLPAAVRGSILLLSTHIDFFQRVTLNIPSDHSDIFVPPPRLV